MSKRMLFIYNPYSGKGRIKSKLSDMMQIFSDAGYEIVIYPTKASRDAFHYVLNRTTDYDFLVCSGGDGTLNEVVSGMMQLEKKVPIGYIPAGSTNDFARSLGLPQDMEELANTVVNGQSFLCDVGAFNDKSFVYIAAFGLFTDVSYETPQSTKNVLGHMAYVLEGMKRLSALKTYHMSVQTENDTFEGDYLFGMVTNSTSVGGFRNIAGEYIELNDGMFEVTLIKEPQDVIELNELMAALVLGETDIPSIIVTKAKRVIFESKQEIAWTIDGEFGGEYKKTEIKCIPKAIEIIV